MAEIPRPISDTELEVLKSLWEEGDGAVRDIQERLRLRERSWAYTTVQTLLHRLQVKGYVTSEKRGRAFIFTPVVSRDQLLNHQLNALAKRVCEGSSTPLMLTLVQGKRFSVEEIREFRELLDKLEGQSGTAAQKRSRKKPRGR